MKNIKLDDGNEKIELEFSVNGEFIHKWVWTPDSHIKTHDIYQRLPK